MLPGDRFPVACWPILENIEAKGRDLHALLPFDISTAMHQQACTRLCQHHLKAAAVQVAVDR